MKGTLVNNFQDYKDYVAKNYSDYWKKASANEIYNQFGRPDKYPFVFVLLQHCGESDPGPFGNSPDLTKIYF